MPDTGRALRETSDALIRDLETLGVLEEEKRGIPPGDPRIVDLATQIESIAARVLVASAHERQLTEQIQDLAEAGVQSPPKDSIEDTARPISAILSDWRAAERRLAAAEEGTAEHREAEVLVEHLREEYRAAHDSARRPE